MYDLWYRLKRWVISIRLEVYVNSMNWGAPTKLYGVLFGKWKIPIDREVPTVPVNNGEPDYDVLGKILVQYPIHHVSIDYTNAVLRGRVGME